MRKIILLALLMLTSCLSAVAQTDSLTDVEYTEARPLVYEDAWDLWPYSFLNDDGEPDGFAVELIQMMMKRLNIPYVIKLKPRLKVLDDLKNGRADLTLEITGGFTDQFGLYGQNVITLLTQSIVSPKGKPVEIKNFHDLKDHKVYVNDSSFVHCQMIDYGWGANAIPVDDMHEAIQKVSDANEGYIVWNTLSLKWLMRRYHTDNLQLTPVSMPHGEYSFMSNNHQLLDRLDKAYVDLYSEDRITPLMNRWFYPERQEEGMPIWGWCLLGGIGLVVLVLAVFSISYNIQVRRLRPTNERLNKRLALVLQTSHVRIWTYNVDTQQFCLRNDNGQPTITFTKETFAQRFSEDDFNQLSEILEQLANSTPPADGAPEEKVKMELRALDKESGDERLCDFLVAISVLTRDKNGKPLEIVGMNKDVTEDRKQQRIIDELVTRYWSIVHTPLMGIILFDRQGQLVDINEKACQLYGADHDAIISAHTSIHDFINLGDLPLEKADGYYATQMLDFDAIPEEKRKRLGISREGKSYHEYRLMAAYDDDDQQLIGIFATMRDVTLQANADTMISAGQQRLDTVKSLRNDYARYIDETILRSDLRIVSYSPDDHTFSIYHRTGGLQHRLTQARCMTLVDSNYEKQAMRLLNDMDEGEDRPFDNEILTNLRTPKRYPLHLRIIMRPVKDKGGSIVRYEGLLQDISDINALEALTAIENEKVQEVENTKSTFVKNMVQEIRWPMDQLLDYVGQLDERTVAPDEAQLYDGIQQNADYLIHLIDNILFLSRLEARMVEFAPQPRDFAEIFESMCDLGWMKHRQPGVAYTVENPYEQLILNIDSEHLEMAIERLTANAAQHTSTGSVRTRYDYIGGRLLIFIGDTGEGISPKELQHINNLDTHTTNDTKGLGLAIVKEIVKQMGGSVDISSEEGAGTVVFITIPCKAIVVKRKKIA